MGILNTYRYVQVKALENCKLSSPVKYSLRTDTFSSNVSVPCTVGKYYLAFGELSSSQSGDIYVVNGGTLITRNGASYYRAAIFRADATTVNIRSTNGNGFWDIMVLQLY